MKICKYNLAILCEKQDKCISCRWNPKVMEERKTRKEVKVNED